MSKGCRRTATTDNNGSLVQKRMKEVNHTIKRISRAENSEITIVSNEICSSSLVVDIDKYEFRKKRILHTHRRVCFFPSFLAWLWVTRQPMYTTVNSFVCAEWMREQKLNNLLNAHAKQSARFTTPPVTEEKKKTNYKNKCVWYSSKRQHLFIVPHTKQCQASALPFQVVVRVGFYVLVLVARAYVRELMIIPLNLIRFKRIPNEKWNRCLLNCFIIYCVCYIFSLLR